MIRNAPPRPLLAPLLLAGLLLVSACGDDAEPAGSPAPASPSAVASDSAAPTAVASSVPTDDVAVDVNLTVTKGKVTGDTGRVQVALGSKVRITVLSDTADEIHVHGYDVKQLATAGQPAQLELTADVPGVFEVELEREHLLLTRLQVQ